MIPSILSTSRDLQTALREDEDNVLITVSRGREVRLSTKHLSEGLYLFKHHEDDKVYKGVPTYTANLAAIKLKALAHGQTIIAPVRKAYRKIVKATDLSNDVLNNLFGYDVELASLEDFTFEVKAQEPIQITTKRNDITSIEIENQFRSGSAFTRNEETEDPYELKQSMDGTNEDVFLAYIFKERNQDLVIIDVGELWDTHRISFDDLLDILTSSKTSRTGVKEWARNLGALTPEQKKELSDKHDTMNRVKAFDDIMKKNNSNFTSNKE